MIQCRDVARNVSTKSINHFKIKCLRFVVVWFLFGIGNPNPKNCTDFWDYNPKNRYEIWEELAEVSKRSRSVLFED